MLIVEGLTKYYGDLAAVRDVSLKVAKGEVVAICGRSGSGKSTFLRCINYLEVPDAGNVAIGEIEIKAGPMTLEKNRKIRELRLRTGMVFQDFNLFPHRTALQNVMEGLTVVKGMTKSEAMELGKRQMSQVGLADKFDSYPNRLSGGQQQRVAIARALAMNPDLMMFDEPTSALDPELIEEVLNVMRDLADRGMTMVVVSHELGFAAEVADRLLYMDAGEFIEQGRPRELMKSPQSPSLKRFLDSIMRT